MKNLGVSLVFLPILLTSACSSPPTFPEASLADRVDAVAQDHSMEAATSPDASMDAAMEAATSPDVANVPDTLSASDGAAVSDASDAAADVVVPLEPETGRTLVFVLDTLTIEETRSPTRAGFNIDGIYSHTSGSTPRSCMKGDAVSSLDSDQNASEMALDPATGRATAPGSMCVPGVGCRGGVDNQLPAIADTIMGFGMNVRAETQRRVTQSENVFVIRVTDVDDLTNDPAVTIKIYEAFATFSSNCTSVLPDRQYAIAQEALLPGTMDIAQARFSLRARIVDGRVQALSGATLRLPAAPGLVLDVLSTQIRADLTETTLASGNLGGYARGGQFYDGLVAMNPLLASLAGPLVADFCDLEEPLPTPGSAMGLCALGNARPPRFGNIGIGARFTAVRATVAAMPLSARPAGACGSRP
ncbi:MAG: hypothetical protein Q8Q09_19750 [Deltaproteobacteria bacterium]|nr:hypothetical protein [Deltaproteobacteria bacterium]